MGSKGEYNGHLKQYAKGITNIIRMKFRKTLGTIATLHQKRTPSSSIRQCRL